MTEPLTIVQKRYSETLTFRFEDERLIRTHADRTGANELAIYYNNIDVQNWTTVNVDRLKRHRYTIWTFCVLCLLAALASPPTASRVVLWFATLVSFGLALAQRRKWIATRYTMFRLQEPQSRFKFLKVLRDGEHDRIVAELKSRWKARMRRVAGEIDFGADPLKEQRKFEWLRDNGVIDADECRSAVERIRAARATAGWPAAQAAGGRLN